MQKRVSIHAKERCHERFGVSNKKIKDVMMYGYSPVAFEGAFKNFLMSVQNTRGGAVTVKVKDNMVVIYNKRSQRAITCYKVPNRYMPWEEYLVPRLRKKVDCCGDGSAEEGVGEIQDGAQGILQREIEGKCEENETREEDVQEALRGCCRTYTEHNDKL